MAQEAAGTKMQSAEVRSKLVDALKLDLVATSTNLGNLDEALPQWPSRWYLTGFLVPIGAERDQRTDEAATEDLDQPGEAGGTDDDVPPERPATRQRYLPSSIGMSVLLPASATRLEVRVSWGDYERRSESQSSQSQDEWQRKPRSETVTLEISVAKGKPREKNVPNSKGLVIAWLSRPVGMLAEAAGVPANTRTVSVFVVNRRAPAPDIKKDEAFAFQVQLEVSGDAEFISRPDLRSLASGDWDERVAGLQYP